MVRAGNNEDAAARRERLARELRENLKRRKVRKRSESAKKVAGSTGQGEPEDGDR